MRWPWQPRLNIPEVIAQTRMTIDTLLEYEATDEASRLTDALCDLLRSLDTSREPGRKPAMTEDWDR